MALPIRILIAEPHSVCRRAMTQMIRAGAGELSVVAEGSGDRRTPDDVVAARVDVVLLGLEHGTGDGVIREIAERAPNVRILVVSARHDADALVEALLAGAAGFLPQSAEPAEVLDALSRVARGEIVIHHSVSIAGLLCATQRLRQSAAEGRLLGRLTNREREVLGFLAEGLSAAAIGARLFLSRRTVERHLATAYRKLGVHGRLDAVREFRRLVPMDGLDPDLDARLDAISSR